MVVGGIRVLCLPTPPNWPEISSKPLIFTHQIISQFRDPQHQARAAGWHSRECHLHAGTHLSLDLGEKMTHHSPSCPLNMLWHCQPEWDSGAHVQPWHSLHSIQGGDEKWVCLHKIYAQGEDGSGYRDLEGLRLHGVEIIWQRTYLGKRGGGRSQAHFIVPLDSTLKTQIKI